jgi:hypothetical protein
MNPIDPNLTGDYEDAILALRERLLDTDPSVSATAVFHLEGGRTLRVENVDPDSISPKGMEPGVIGVESGDHNDRVLHVPFVLYWEIEWN